LRRTRGGMRRTVRLQAVEGWQWSECRGNVCGWARAEENEKNRRSALTTLSRLDPGASLWERLNSARDEDSVLGRCAIVTDGRGGGGKEKRKKKTEKKKFNVLTPPVAIWQLPPI
jgi:hypothetical protein